ncbi:hypothetical protein SCHPADRAFT_948058 [Schizopora paradoxa]|uniref:Uncharacterized protein n=1 Tax=Schizopora paradoxa TaxID=27342 RepID=A0A0H2RGG3_9AGAM|nr:hypothetical protein SCHPADRAFT_948058 [Schizopora paradoxa]
MTVCIESSRRGETIFSTLTVRIERSLRRGIHLLRRTSPLPANVNVDVQGMMAAGASNASGRAKKNAGVVPLVVDGRGASGTEETAGERDYMTSIGPQRGNLCSYDSWGPQKLSVTSFTFDALTLFGAYATYVLLYVDTKYTAFGIDKGRSKKRTPQELCA